MFNKKFNFLLAVLVVFSFNGQAESLIEGSIDAGKAISTGIQNTLIGSKNTALFLASK